MGETISKEVKELADKAEAMLPKIKFDTADKLPEIDTTSSKELASTLGNLVKKISETTSARLANIQKKISESTANSIANLQKKTNESAAVSLAALSKKIGESSALSAASLTNLQKRITTNSLPAFAKKINEATVTSLSGLEKRIQQSTAKTINIQRSLEAVCKKQGLSSQRLSSIEGILNEFVKNKSNFHFGKLAELQKQLATKDKEIAALNNRLGRVYRIIKIIITLLLLTAVIYFAYRYYKQHNIPGKVQQPILPRYNDQRGY